ncbi:hypothetical protein FTO70_11985 [Methanosarcina sp. KYL-1]|nr:hypothetical protein [Methanosarcina sp. KYL-1]
MIYFLSIVPDAACYIHQCLHFLIVGKEQITIDQKVTLDELNSLIRNEKNPGVLKRLQSPDHSP